LREAVSKKGDLLLETNRNVYAHAYLEASGGGRRDEGIAWSSQRKTVKKVGVLDGNDIWRGPLE